VRRCIPIYLCANPCSRLLSVRGVGILREKKRQDTAVYIFDSSSIVFTLPLQVQRPKREGRQKSNISESILLMYHPLDTPDRPQIYPFLGDVDPVRWFSAGITPCTVVLFAGYLFIHLMNGLTLSEPVCGYSNLQPDYIPRVLEISPRISFLGWLRPRGMLAGSINVLAGKQLPILLKPSGLTRPF
jgi:hypothetical protein